MTNTTKRKESPVSYAATNWAIRKVRGLMPSEKLVLIILTDYADANELTCFPSHNAIVDASGLSRNTVLTATKSLKEKGYIETINRRDKRGIKTSNLYRINAPPEWMKDKEKKKEKEKERSKLAFQCPPKTDQQHTTVDTHVAQSLGNGCTMVGHGGCTMVGHEYISRTFNTPLEEHKDLNTYSASDDAAHSPPMQTSKKSPTTPEQVELFPAEEDRITSVPEKKLRTSKGHVLSGRSLELFNEFWNAFDYKKGRAEAAEAWWKIKPGEDLAREIIAGALSEASHRSQLISSGRTPKMAQGWLTGRRWEDEIMFENRKESPRHKGPEWLVGAR